MLSNRDTLLSAVPELVVIDLWSLGSSKKGIPLTLLGVAEVDAELVADPLDDDGGQYDHAGPQTQSFQLLTERTAPVGKGFYRDAGTVGDLLTGHGLHEVKS